MNKANTNEIEEIPRQRHKNRKRFAVLGVILILIVVFVLSPLFNFVRSIAVMGVYSGMNERNSLLSDEGIEIKVKGGVSTNEKDWYPFAMTFSADNSYARYIGEENARLTIIYNFPSFEYAKGCSNLFNEESPYYNAFYGAYAVQGDSNESLKRGELDENVAASVARFDFFELVLSDFGLKSENEIFEFDVIDREEGIDYVGYDSWTKIKADMTVNGAAHNSRKDVVSYLQYGEPNFGEVKNEFAPIQMTGIVYGRYFEEWDTGIYIYVMASDEDICHSCDEDILSKTIIRNK